MKKKIVILLGMILMMTCLCGVMMQASALDASVNDATAEKGGEVTFTVTLSEDVAAKSGSVAVNFDSEALTLQSATWNFDPNHSPIITNFDTDKNLGAFADSAPVQLPLNLFTVVFHVTDMAAFDSSEVRIDIVLMDADNQPIEVMNQPGVCTVVCLNHVFGEWTMEGGRHTRSCACGAIESGDHVYDIVEILSEVSHLSEGRIRYTCSVCGDYYEELTPATPEHEFSAWLDYGDEHFRSCDCGATESGPHLFDDGYISIHPTHDQEGEMTYVCTACDTTRTESIDRLTDHLFGEWMVEGDYHVHYCICGESEAMPHVFDGGTVIEEPTHMSTGLINYVCVDCYTEQQEITDALPDHEFGEWLVDGDSHYRTCPCGEVESFAHDFGEATIIQEPTHLQAGIQVQVCSTCSHEMTSEIERLSDHDFGGWNFDEGSHYRTCPCGETESFAHEFGEADILQQPTHTQEGKSRQACVVCKYETITEVERLPDHTFGEWMYDEYNHFKECECGNTETLPHVFDAGVVTEAATHMSEGIRTYTCADCGFQKTERIDRTPDHSFESWRPHSDEEHIRYCECGESELAAHNRKGDTCSVCGQDFPSEGKPDVEHPGSEQESVTTGNNSNSNSGGSEHKGTLDINVGCKGSVGLTGMVMLSTLGAAAFVALRKKKED